MTRTLPQLAVAGVLACLGMSTAATADVQPHAGMLRYPDISKDKIVFSYANDLWIVDRDGGRALPLASPPGMEQFPRFSADGKTIAFVGNYEGGRDIYTIPVVGGIPQRVTHHPTSERLCDWTPDGELMYSASGVEGAFRMPKLHTVSARGGLPETLPLPYGANGSLHEDGEWLVYTPHQRDNRTWKRYRGGMASELWLFNLDSHESKQLTEWEGTDTLPMWHGDRIYYLSDEGPNHRLNIWSIDPDSGKKEQITKYKEYDVKWPSLGPGKNGQGEIIFQNGPTLYVLDLGTEKAKSIQVSIPGDRPKLRTQRVDVSNYIQGAGISATGKRAVTSARGDIWTHPAETGLPRNLTMTDGTAERDPSWSPDGRWIAYFSDKTGEYELYVTQSDGKGETKQLTEDSETYYYNPIWSPDSEHIVFTDKAYNVYLHTLESGETRIIDTDPYGETPTPSWSHDSKWLTYAKTGEHAPITSVWLYDVETDEKHQVTHGMFPDRSPVFDRKGDYLYFASSRSFNPTYSDIDTTFIYNDSQVLVAVPLREDVELPWQVEIDEETWEEEKDEDEEKADDATNGEEGDDENGDGDAEDAENGDEAEDANGADEPAAPTSPIHGNWEGTLSGLSAMGAPPEMDSIAFTMTIIVAEDGAITGSSEVMGESDEFDEITFDEASGEFVAKSSEEGINSVMRATLEGDTLTGTWEIIEMGVSGTWEATKVSEEVDEEAAAEAGDDDEAAETVEIDLEGFEHRAFQLPVSPGRFGQLAVNNRNQLLYVRPGKGVMLFDLDDDSKNEKTVAAGAFGFDISGDGKKLLIPTPRGVQIRNAAPGGSGQSVVTDNMIARINPRDEWRQIFNDAWRIQRDFFYVENMHGVDWEGVRKQYAAMLDDCASREDLSYVIGEMIGEINVGHAYYFGGDTEDQPREPVGMLGVDYAHDAENDAYQISRIYEGGVWDLDAKNPLRASDKNVNEGEYLLAVNGMPVDTDRDPWAAFIGTAGRPITITVSEKPTMDEDAREIVVEPMRSDGNLRFRAWIEDNRRYVDEQTDGQVGYIYVRDTGRGGQNDLVRQYIGQLGKKALIIDERWNGGGQIPTRFIEMLNRPVTNYWARRDSKDWVWPPDAHHGPKCMLINGLAGSGGDMFPWLFKEAGLGKLIGTRTWGGLVGISGNPPLIDGGYTSAPTFGFYEKDGTWGIEGHGTEPDIRVVDDPAKMVDGGDPQLDAAIELMLKEIKENPFVRPQRPEDPDRSGMGIAEEDK